MTTNVNNDGEELLGVALAAKHLPHESEHSLRRGIASGKFKAEKRGWAWYFTMDEVQRIKKLKEQDGL